MIAKITFLIQSSNHLLPTVNKLVCNNPTRARQNNMASVHIFVDQPILSLCLIQCARICDHPFLGAVCTSVHASIKQSVPVVAYMVREI